MTAYEQTRTLSSGPDSGEEVRVARRFDLDSAYREHAADLSRWLRRLARKEDVSDLLHEVFVVAERRGSEFRGDAALRTWLYAIAVRVVSGWRRKQRVRRWLFLEPKPGDETPEPVDPKTPDSTIASKRASEAVHRVLERLSERDRMLIVAFELEGLSAAEVGVVAGLSPNAVWVALHRARAHFRNVFVDLYGSEE